MSLSPINLSQFQVGQLIEVLNKHSDYKQLTPTQRKAVKLIFEKAEGSNKDLEFTAKKEIKILQAAGIIQDTDIDRVCKDLKRTDEKSKSELHKRIGKGIANRILGRVSSKELKSVINQSYDDKIKELAESLVNPIRSVPKKSEFRISDFMSGRSTPNLNRHEKALLAEIKAQTRQQMTDYIKEVRRVGVIMGPVPGRDQRMINQLQYMANQEYKRIEKLLNDIQSSEPTSQPQTPKNSQSRRSALISFHQRRESPKLDKSTVLKEIKRVQTVQVQLFQERLMNKTQ